MNAENLDSPFDGTVTSEDLQAARAKTEHAPSGEQITVMPDARITKFSARMKMTTAYGSRVEYDYHSKIAEPHKVLLEVLRELARIAAVAGLEREARAEVEDAFKAVAEWYAEQSR